MINDGLKEIPIEERNENEVKYIKGLLKNGQLDEVLIYPSTTPMVLMSRLLG